MVQSWYIDEKNDNEDNKQSEMHCSPPVYIDLDELFRKSGVLYWKIDVDRLKDEGLYDKIRHDRGYSYQDIIEISKDKLPDFDTKIKMFYEEHFHADEEIRFVMEGSGYFDVRDVDDKWIRILVTKGDLIVLPAGIHHRFTLDTTNHIKVTRLFVGTPVWAAIKRPNDQHEARIEYVKQIKEGFKK